MPKPKDSRPPQKRTVKTPYRQSNNFMSITADGSVVSGRHDDFGSVIQITLTKTEPLFKSDTMTVELINNGVKQTGPQTFEMEEFRSVLCIISLRPDHALGLISAIVAQLTQMPQHLRDKYNIPPFELVIGPEQSQ